MTIRVDLFWNVLPVMGYGLLGIFLITGVIIGVVLGLNRWKGPDNS